jgi:hypothetical protein
LLFGFTFVWVTLPFNTSNGLVDKASSDQREWKLARMP